LLLLIAAGAGPAAAQPLKGEPSRAERERMRERFENATPAEREVMRRAMRDRVRDRLQDLPPRERRERHRRWESASPEEHQVLRREIIRRTLTNDERERLRRLIEGGQRTGIGAELRAVGEDLGGLDADERRALRNRVRALPRGDRHALQRKLSQYRSLSKDEQQSLRQQLNRLRAMDAKQRNQLEIKAERFRALPENEKQRMRDAWKRLETMPSEERKALLDQLLGSTSR
jgi:hypothetical protein